MKTHTQSIHRGSADFAFSQLADEFSTTAIIQFLLFAKFLSIGHPVKAQIVRNAQAKFKQPLYTFVTNTHQAMPTGSLIDVVPLLSRWSSA